MASVSSERAHLVFVALLLGVSVSSAFAPNVGDRGNASKCLTRFQKSPDAFSQCLTQPCFLFLQEEPYVEIDTVTMTDESHQVLFPCNRPTSRFPGMKGTIFAVHKAMSAKNSLCVWGGAECTFNDMTAFLSKQSARYQFGIIGLLLESPSRVTNTLYPSSSIVDSLLVIVGPRRSVDGRTDPLYILQKPFQHGAWSLFWSMITLFFIFGLMIIFVFTPDRVEWQTLFFHFVGEPVDDSLGANLMATPNTSTDPNHSTATRMSSWQHAANFIRRRRDSVRESLSGALRSDDVENYEDDSRSKIAKYKASLWLFHVSISASLVIFVLFYEIAIVNFMFYQNNAPAVQNIERLSREQLSKYAVLKSSGIEDIWRKIVDPYDTYNASTLPWYRCESSSDCFDKIIDQNHRAKYTVTFDNFAHHEMIKRGLCDKLTIYSTDRCLYSFGAGWLYGKGIRMDRRVQIDKDILKLRVTDKIRDLLKSGDVKALTCTERPAHIVAPMVGVAVLALVVPFLVLLTTVLGVAWFKRCRRSE